jgi:hypothetical protein
MTASPTNFSTVPPWIVSTSRIAANQRFITLRTDSGSRRSPSPVESATSQKTTVTVLRAAVSECASGEPQTAQKLADGGLSAPHVAHAAMP